MQMLLIIKKNYEEVLQYMAANYFLCMNTGCSSNDSGKLHVYAHKNESAIFSSHFHAIES